LWTLHWINNQQGDWAEAQSLAAAAVAKADKSGRECAELANILHGLASALNRQSRFAEAEAPARRAVNLLRRLSGPSHPETAWGLVLADSLVRQGHYDQAEAPLQESLLIFRRHYRPAHKSVGMISESLRQVLLARGDQAGLDKLAAALVSDAARAAQQKPASAEPWMVLAVAQVQTKQWAQVVENCEKACAIAAQPDSPEASRPQLLARCDVVIAGLTGAQRHAEATRVAGLAISMAEVPGATDSPPATRLTNSCGTTR
jgi:tetratricopeptide (TPR) repeat protein